MTYQKSIERGENIRKTILDYITNYIQLHGYSPSFRESGDSVNLKSTSSVHTQLQKMLETGELETDAPPGTPRAI